MRYENDGIYSGCGNWHGSVRSCAAFGKAGRYDEDAARWETDMDALQKIHGYVKASARLMRGPIFLMHAN